MVTLPSCSGLRRFDGLIHACPAWRVAQSRKRFALYVSPKLPADRPPVASCPFDRAARVVGGFVADWKLNLNSVATTGPMVDYFLINEVQFKIAVMGSATLARVSVGMMNFWPSAVTA